MVKGPDETHYPPEAKPNPYITLWLTTASFLLEKPEAPNVLDPKVLKDHDYPKNTTGIVFSDGHMVVSRASRKDVSPSNPEPRPDLLEIVVPRKGEEAPYEYLAALKAVDFDDADPNKAIFRKLLTKVRSANSRVAAEHLA